MKVWHWAILMGGFALAGCASSADNIAPSYVSPLAYENYDCDQLAQEAQRLSARAAIASGQQDKSRSGDAVATTVGVVLFWPALFLLDGDGPKAAEVARLKGEMEAVEAASIQKRCRITFRRT
jgi:hypothetical protein